MLSTFWHYIIIQLSSTRINLRRTAETVTDQRSLHGLVIDGNLTFLCARIFVGVRSRLREADERTQLHTLRMGPLIMFPVVNSGARRAAKRSAITIGTEPHANIEVEKKVKCDHRSKFSNLSNWKVEA